MTRQPLLIIDDDPVVCAALSRDLERFGFSVESVGSLKEAELLQHRYRVIVVDYQLGTHTGFDVIRALRHRHPQARFVLLTGEHNLSVPSSFTERLAEVIHKPWDTARLVDALRAASWSEAPPSYS